MFPGETKEDLITTLAKNNFDLELSVNEVLCNKAGDSILTLLDMDIVMVKS